MKKIETIKKKLNLLGSMLPGKIAKQWNVCGTKGCKCKRLKNPVKHGPYYQISFTAAGKSSTIFIKKEELSEVKKRIKNFKKFKELNKELILANIALFRKEKIVQKQGVDK